MVDEKKEFELEQSRLDQTITLAKQQIEEAKVYNEKKKAEILEAKREMRENTVHSVGNLWSSDGFEALAEMSQYANDVTDKLVDYEEVQKKLGILERMLDTPYFARIDFLFDDDDTHENIYIGRASLKDETNHKIYIYDWRSPIASVFYRFVLGKAFYDAPGGRIRGTVELKRQYEIKQGILEYFFDADVQIVDEFLKKLLSQNTSPQMKAIVETIQKEQDTVIRDMSNELMMVQGVAGSGKTSIALHRAAYLMYEGLSEKLKAENIIIISPNTLFEQYISNVLPELGESNIESIVFEEMAAKILKRNRIQSRNQFLETLITNADKGEVIKQSIEFKTSYKFRAILDLFIKDIPIRWIRFTDIYYEGTCVVGKRVLRNWVMKHSDIPLCICLERLEEYVLELVRAHVGRRLRKAEEKEIRAEMQPFTEVNIFELYKDFFRDKEYFFTLIEDIEDNGCTEDIWDYTVGNLESGILHYDDAIPITYFHLCLQSNDSYKSMKQVVIDEAQDYYPLQYKIFSMLFRNAKYTVLGDMNQTLEKQEDLSLYEGIAGVLQKKKATLITMDKSFRCTNEILNYSLHFIHHNPEIKSFNRKGEEPQIYQAADTEELGSMIAKEVKVCVENGFQSIGLVCKSAKNAKLLYDCVKNSVDAQLIKEGMEANLQGVFIIPIYMSKGLEFDAVLICDVNEENYNDEDDKKSLYIACTRALHRLNLFYIGQPSPLL